MTVGDERYEAAIRAIDAANADDPNTIVVRGEERAKELAHAELVTEWVHRLRPGDGAAPAEALLLAARAHHLRRWVVPRTDYPEGRNGYLKWRRDLHTRHADETGELLRQAGYDDTTVERVGDIIKKRRLATDPDVQTLEDAMCLVFLETQFDDLAKRTEAEKMVEIVRKTLEKMSPVGIEHALALAAALPEEDQAILRRAVSPGGTAR